MKRSSLLAITALVTVLGAGSVAALQGSDLMHRAHWKSHARMDAHGHRAGDWCGHFGNRHFSDLAGYMPTYLRLDDQQSQRWRRVADRLNAVLQGLAADCAAKEVGNERTAPERLAVLRGSLDKGIAAIDAVADDFTAFYASLDKAQREKLEQMWEGKHRR